MPRPRKGNFDENTIARFVENGRGQGHGSTYQPWLTVNDASSSGLTSRPTGATTGRTHHLLSKLELHYFLICDFLENVTDIRERFPLSRGDTLAIADQMQVQHPTYNDRTTPMVMTTDFLLDTRNKGKRTHAARSVIYAKNLANPETRKLLEIERRYWTEKKVDWGIVTERSIPKHVILNLDWISGPNSIAGLSETEAEADVLLALEAAIQDQPDKSIGEFCACEDTRKKRKAGSTLGHIRHAISAKRIRANFRKELWNPATTISVLFIHDTL